jgi:hypothetical protein
VKTLLWKVLLYPNLLSGLAVGNLVVPEPFEDFLQLPRKLPEKGRRQHPSYIMHQLIMHNFSNAPREMPERELPFRAAEE